MGQRIDQFCENLRLKLTNVDSNMNALKAKIDSKAQGAERDVQNHLDAVDAHIAQQRAKGAAAQAEMKNWVEERKATTTEKVAAWKTKLEKTKLQRRGGGGGKYGCPGAPPGARG